MKGLLLAGLVIFALGILACGDESREAGDLAGCGSTVDVSFEIVATSGNEIFVVDSEGCYRRSLTAGFSSSIHGSRFGGSDYSEYQSPAWSPDGTRIAFGASGVIYTVAPDGSDLRSLITLDTTPNEGAEVEDLTWSPDGNLIALASSDTRVYVIDLGGHVLANVFGALPSWSPDGHQLALSEDGAIVMNPDGSGKTSLFQIASFPTPLGSLPSFPVWSPDGTHIAVLYNRGVWVMNADGSELTEIASEAGAPFGGAPFAWSPDGERIAFITGDPGGQDGIHIVNADGSGRT